MSSILSHRVAVVTGAGRGIGRAIALAFAAEDAKVVVASRTPSTVKEVVEQIQADGGNAIGIPCDVGDRAAVIAMIDEAVDMYGTVHVLVNNAQGFGTAREPLPTAPAVPLEAIGDDQVEYTFRTGAMATLWSMKAAFPHMKRDGYGRIINMGSVAGQKGLPQLAPYSLTKEAIRALTRTAASEWGKHGITANVLCPVVMTDSLRLGMGEHGEEAAATRDASPVGRIGDPLGDLAPVAVFLASPGAGYLTGQTLNVDGGSYLYA